MNTLLQSILPVFIREQLQRLLQKAAEYRNGLSEREQQLITVAGLLLVIWAGYFGAIQPLQNYHSVSRERLISSQTLYKDVLAAAQRITLLRASIKGRVHVASEEPLDVLVNHAAQKAGISVTSFNRQEDSLLLRVENAGFNALIQWLSLLEAEGVGVSTLQLNRTDKPGVVEIQQLRVSKE